jgi:TonB family protein
MTMTSRLALIAVVASISTASIARAADEPLADAKALFAAASFDGALAALDRLDAANGALPEALEYKALCLLALGRSGDAQTITETLVTTVPTFAPADADLSPRFVELLTETRRRMVPVIARRLFADARDQYRAKNPADARRTFQQVVTLAGDRVWRDTAEADDLRTLASGFLDLLEGAAAPKAAAAEPQPITPTAVPRAPVAVTPTAVPPAPVAVATAAALGQVQAPVPIRQSMPQWVAPDRVSALRTFHGAIKVRIGADGHVVDVAVATATHPDYDKQLLETARDWMYKPATRNGQPIEVEKVVEFYLRSK